jgi:hypothetical protein
VDELAMGLAWHPEEFDVIVLPIVMGYDGRGIAVSFRGEEWVLARTLDSRIGGQDRQPPG